MAYERKIDKEHFEIKLHSTNDGERFWMEITSKDPYASASCIVHYPNIIERVCGVTPLEKLEAAKEKLFKEVRRELEGANPEIVAAIDEFCKEND